MIKESDVVEILKDKLRFYAFMDISTWNIVHSTKYNEINVDIAKAIISKIKEDEKINTVIAEYPKDNIKTY